jgi:transcriptional regulator with XRE-family HTH domain
MGNDETTGGAALLGELGNRLTRRRLRLELTQAEAARRAGIGKRTLERIEAGHDTQLSTFLRLLGALELLDGLESIVPEPRMSPVQLVKLQGRQRKRAGARARESRDGGWSWGDER